jgi:hypothetical protein
VPITISAISPIEREFVSIHAFQFANTAAERSRATSTTTTGAAIVTIDVGRCVQTAPRRFIVGAMEGRCAD